jgi:methyltransferase (TIGR00027 family)
MADLVIARTLYFDRILERLMGDAGQLVLLGAGYDTRAYGSFRRQGVASFEVDQKSVQKHKRSTLAAAGIDIGDTRFVSVDFAQDDLFEQLAQAGYDPAVRTIFLWEGVTLYLSQDAVRQTMRAVRDHASPGSVLLADVYAERMIQMGKSKAVSRTLDYTDEGFGFGLPFASEHEAVLRDFVENESLTMGETFFLGSASDKGPFSVVVEMVV